MFLTNYNRVIRELKDSKYILYVSDERECKLISKGENIAPDHEIIAHGDSTTMDNFLAGRLLPPPEFIHNRLNNKMCDSYKCWACEDLKIDQYIAHIEPINSWECLMAVMGNPRWVVVIKQKLPNATD